MTVDPFLLRGAELGRGLARGAGRGRRRGLPRGRWRLAADRVRPAGGRDPARPRAVGAARGVRRGRCGTVRPAAACASCCATPRAVIVGSRGDRAGGPAACSASGAIGCASCRSPPRPAFSLAAPASAIGPDAAADVTAPRPRARERYLVFTGRFDAAPGSRRRCLRALAALAAAGRPGRARSRRALAAAGAARRGHARGSGRRRPRRGARVASVTRSPTRRPCRPSELAGARPRRPRGLLPVLSEARRAAGHRGARDRDAGRRLSGRAAPRARRAGRAAGRAARSGPAGSGARGRSGPTTGSTNGWSPRARRARRVAARTWADVADATRRVYAEVGVHPG